MSTKRFLSLIISFGMLITMTMSITAFATNNGPDIPTEPPAYSVTINEYDVYVQARKLSNKELSSQGMSETYIDLIKSNAIEDRLLELAALPANKLSEMGYTNNEITILKNYDGEPIENNPELRQVFSDMSMDFYPQVSSSVTLKLRIYWKWTRNGPVLVGTTIKDIAAVRWKGTNTAGNPYNLAFYPTTSSADINYYTTSGTFRFVESFPIVCDDPYAHAYVTVPTALYTDCVAKSGNLYIQLMRTGTDYIKEAAFIFGYGHTVISITPSVSFPDSFNLEFGFGMEEIVKSAIRMTNTGTIIKY